MGHLNPGGYTKD